MASDFLMGLITIGESNITKLVTTKDGSAINMHFIKQDRAIEKLSSGDDKVDNNGIVDTNSTKVLKSVKFSDLIQPKKTGAGFFTPEARLAFTQLKEIFIKVPILYHFNPESHIQIETDVLDYAIDKILSQLTADNSD